MNVFTKTTVDSVMAGFTKTLEQLREVQDIQFTANNHLLNEIDLLEEKRMAAYTESTRARTLIMKFEELLG